jgi:kumamolisin
VSWGRAEKFWTDAARDAMQAALADAKRLQVSVLFAAGDELATGGLTDGKAHVWFPASSPYVLACGGTLPTLAADGIRVANEVVWNDGAIGTGGGISDAFPVPAYQSGFALPPSVNDGKLRRGVPDVAAAAAGRPGYRIVLNGTEMVKDGTSAVAPPFGPR